jgi:hypothetical protein
MTIHTSHFFSSKISLTKGVVSNLSNELLEYVNPEKPTHSDSPIYFKRFYISRFNLNNEVIEAAFSSPMKIADGDIVSVAGQQKSNAFKVLAYKNQTQDITQHENWIALIFGAIFFFAIALVLLNGDLALEGMLIPRLLLFGFALVGIYMGYRALLIREAVKLIGTK